MELATTHHPHHPLCVSTLSPVIGIELSNQVQPERILLFIIRGVGGGGVSYLPPTRQVTSYPGSVSSRVSWERVQPSELGN